MHAAMTADTGIWGAPKGALGTLALWAMALKNGGQNRAALRALDLQRGDVVLEIGSGPGEALRKVVRTVGRTGFVAGVDTSDEAVRMSARAIDRAVLSGRAFVTQAEAQATPFREATFDKVFAVNSFMFWPEPARALREIARVLRPGGRLVITQRGAHPENPTEFAGAHEGIDRIGQAAQLLKAAGWRLLDERADADGPRLIAFSVVAERPA